MIPSSACQPWRADQPGNAGQLGNQCRQLHHSVGHHLGSFALYVPGLVCRWMVDAGTRHQEIADGRRLLGFCQARCIVIYAEVRQAA